MPQTGDEACRERATRSAVRPVLADGLLYTERLTYTKRVRGATGGASWAFCSCVTAWP